MGFLRPLSGWQGRPRGRAVAEALEPRLLFSADNPVATGAALAPASAGEPVQVAPAVVPDALPVAADPAEGTGAVPGSAAGAPASPTSAAQIAAAPVAAEATGPELVVVDTRIADLQDVLADLHAQQQAGRPLDILVVDAGDDGIGAITGRLAQASAPYSAIHLLAHGAAGRVELGATPIDLESVRARAGQFAAWADALSPSADLLIYGCDVAAGADGLVLLDALARLTGADVAASDDPTGAARLGGDWDLEARTGTIDVAGVLSDAERARFDGVLGVYGAGAETLVNANTSGTQAMPAGVGGNQVATNGTYTAVVWEDASSGNTVVMARVFGALGLPVTGEFQVNSTTSATATQPVVAMDASGNFVVVWITGSDGSGTGIAARRFAANGAALSGELSVANVPAQDQLMPAVAFNPSNGDYTVTWTSWFTINNSYGVEARTFAADGTPRGPEVAVNVTGPRDQSRSAIAYAGDGTGMVVWQNRSASGDWDIYGRMLDASGAPVGGEIHLNAASTLDQSDAAVSGDASGHFVVVWTHDGGGSATTDIRARVVNPGGTLRTGEIQVNTTTDKEQAEASVAMRANGEFVVAWQSRGQDGSGGEYGVYAAQFDLDGHALIAEERVNATTGGDQVAPSVAVDGGTVTFAWSGAGAGDTSGVFVRRWLVDSVGITLTPDTASAIAEDGGTQQLSVALSSEPVADVTVRLALGDPHDGTLSATVLTFTAANWNVPQTVTFTASSDRLVDAGRTATISVTSVTSLDPRYLATTGPAFSQALADGDTVNQLVVDTADDVVDGDVTDARSLWADRGADGHVSLREALLAANATAAGPGGINTIAFALPTGAGSPTITVGSALPTITRALLLDGLSQSGTASSSLPHLALVGQGAYDGLVLAAGSSGSTVQGLAIGGFGGDGIVVRGDDVTLSALFVGTDVTGRSARGNGGAGIHVIGADGTLVRDSLVAGNGGAGIDLDGATNGRVVATRIGEDAAGGALGNGGDGVSLHDGAVGNRVGGTGAGDAVVIRASGGAVVRVVDGAAGSHDNAFLSNVIQGNQAGIVLGGGATVVLAADALDADAGPNGLQNAPQIDSVLADGATMRIAGRLASEPAADYRIEFFDDPGTPAGQSGQGRTLLGALQVTTDADGLVVFTFDAAALAYGATVTATATRVGTGGRWLDTSPFAANAVVAAAPQPLGIPGTLTVEENSTAAITTLDAIDGDDAASSLAWALGGPDAAAFEIRPGNVLALARPANYELPADANGDGVYELTVTVTDPAGHAAAVALQVRVLDVDDAPTLVHAPTALALSTGQQRVLGATELAATDEDDGPAQLTYALRATSPQGTLMRDGQALAAGDRFTQADVDGGRVGFVATQAGASSIVLDLADAAGRQLTGITLATTVSAPAAGPVPAPPSVEPAPAAVVPETAARNGTDAGASERAAETAATRASTTASATAPAVVGAEGSMRARGDGTLLASQPAGTGAHAASAPTRDGSGAVVGGAHERDRRSYEGPVLHDLPAPERRALFEESPWRRFALASVERLSSSDRSGVPVFASSYRDLRDALAPVREQLAERVVIERNLVASSAAVSAGLSIGYVIWLLRGGVLLSSLLASIPAWSSIDPLPVLSNGGGRGRAGDGDDDSLEGMLKKARDADPARHAPAEPPVACQPDATAATHREITPAPAAGRPASGLGR